ncbi:HNH endonuclease signature motif containing protein [Gracilibacillus sp. HCP3S3_G5_1]|uniref:HNH endonuclease signature motif containing protein n=1 Tax=unclassified Gracilibacillus TaxID=2625209 RepID=UPI003F889787
MLTPIYSSKHDYSRYGVDTTNGRVWDYLRERFLTSNPNANGYCYVGLYDENREMKAYGLHRVIMASHSGLDLELFNRGGIEVDHIVPVKEGGTNEISNLQMTDRQGQYKKSTRLKMSKPKPRMKEEDVCLILEQLEEMRRYVDFKQADFINQMCDAYNRDYRTMYNIVTGKVYKDMHKHLY